MDFSITICIRTGGASPVAAIVLGGWVGVGELRFFINLSFQKRDHGFVDGCVGDSGGAG